jgi:hypothetical protein
MSWSIQPLDVAKITPAPKIPNTVVLQFFIFIYLFIVSF